MEIRHTLKTEDLLNLRIEHRATSLPCPGGLGDGRARSSDQREVYGVGSGVGYRSAARCGRGIGLCQPNSVEPDTVGISKVMWGHGVMARPRRVPTR